MSRQDSNKRRTVDGIEQAVQDCTRYMKAALAVIDSANDLLAAASRLVAAWKRLNRALG
jgi:hypothetical protein